MFTLMGKPERKQSGTALRRLHKTSGFVFLFLLLVLTYYCAKFVRLGGDNLPMRAVIHSLLSLGLLIVLLLKVFIVQFYRGLMRFVPVMGIIVFVLALLVYATSAGYFFLVRTRPRSAQLAERAPSLSALEEEGKEVFDRHCVLCHYADRLESKLGPGLKGLLRGETFPASGQPATLENVRRQLLEPTGGMPSFKTTLSEEDLEALLAYLDTL
jgi:mono/diheme cytochrome c family protein